MKIIAYLLLLAASFAFLTCFVTKASPQTQIIHTVVLSKKNDDFPSFISGKLNNSNNDNFVTKNRYTSSRLTCSFNDGNGYTWYTYEALTDKVESNNSASSSYWSHWAPILDASDVVVSSTPIIIEAPTRPLTILPLYDCNNVTINETVFVENNKTMNYVFRQKKKQPIEFTNMEGWGNYTKNCLTSKGNSIEANELSTDANATILAVVLSLLFLPLYCCYRCCCSIRLKRNDPLLKERMDIRVELQIAKNEHASKFNPRILPLMHQDNAANIREAKIEELEEKLKINKIAISNKLKKMKLEAISKADEQRNAKQGDQNKKQDSSQTQKLNVTRSANEITDLSDSGGKKIMTSKVKLCSQFLTILSALLSITSTCLLIGIYASGKLGIYDIRIRLNGTIFANGEIINTVPEPFKCDECIFTFTPQSDDILSVIESNVARNGSEVQNITVFGVNEEVEMRKEGNHFVWENVWGSIPSKNSDTYTMQESHTVCVAKPSFFDMRTVGIFCVLSVFVLCITTLEIVAEFPQLKTLEEKLGLSEYIGICKFKYKSSIKGILKNVSPIFFSLPLNFIIANLQDVGAPIYDNNSAQVWQPKSPKARTIFSQMIMIFWVILACLGIMALYKILLACSKCCKWRKKHTDKSNTNKSNQQPKTTTGRERKAGKCKKCCVRINLYMFDFLQSIYASMAAVTFLIIILNVYAQLFLEQYSGNISFTAILFSVDLPIEVPRMNLPIAHINFVFQSVNKIRAILALVTACTKLGRKASKVQPTNDIMEIKDTVDSVKDDVGEIKASVKNLNKREELLREKEKKKEKTPVIQTLDI